MASRTGIVWFRRDLRIHDNAALQWVLDNCEKVIPVYIHSPQEEVPWSPGETSRWWLHQSLFSLRQSLAEKGLQLNFFLGDSEKILSSIVDETGASLLTYNKIYEKQLYDRDQCIENNLSHKVDVQSFDSGLFFRPGSVLNNQGTPYRVYTPFYRKLRPLLDAHGFDTVDSSDSGSRSYAGSQLDSSIALDALDLLGEHRWYEKLSNYWRPGEDSAHELLDGFIDDAVKRYEVERDIPAQDSTSRLSPYLHFGEITPRQIYVAMIPLLQGEYGEQTAQSVELYIKQLIWREFAHHILWHFPETATQPMNKNYHDDFWRHDDEDFDAWSSGETGIPIIDAGMKQLWETGWMHNRVRMIVSSFLTKNLGIDWRDGARWFWDTLVDADLANNSMGWQWVAGCGVDAAPYYRVFNPEAQTKRFDDKYRYIDRWSPEHVELDYPQPMIDLATSREQALQRYKQSINP